MKTIGDLLSRDLSQQIEEIIKVDQTDEQSVYSEITEYVATDRIKDQYRDLLKAMGFAQKVTFAQKVRSLHKKSFCWGGSFYCFRESFNNLRFL